MKYIPIIIFVLAMLQGTALRAASSTPIGQTAIELPVKPGKKKTKSIKKPIKQQDSFLVVLVPFLLCLGTGIAVLHFLLRGISLGISWMQLFGLIGGAVIQLLFILAAISYFLSFLMSPSDVGLELLSGFFSILMAIINGVYGIIYLVRGVQISLLFLSFTGIGLLISFVLFFLLLLIFTFSA